MRQCRGKQVKKMSTDLRMDFQGKIVEISETLDQFPKLGQLYCKGKMFFKRLSIGLSKTIEPSQLKKFSTPNFV